MKFNLKTFAALLAFSASALAAQQVVNNGDNGITPQDNLPQAFRKTNANDTELYGYYNRAHTGDCTSPVGSLALTCLLDGSKITSGTITGARLAPINLNGTGNGGVIGLLPVASIAPGTEGYVLTILGGVPAWAASAGGGGGGGATNLATANRTATALDITSSTGAAATVPAATTSLAGLITGADQTKLNGIAPGATANSSDATLLNRANHTGSQTASTISDFSTAVNAANTDKGSQQFIFKNVAVAGQPTATATANNDTLTIAGAGGITIGTSGKVVTITQAAGGAAAVAVQDEGSTLTSTLSQLNCVGAGIACSNSGSNVTVTVPGGSTPSDATTTSKGIVQLAGDLGGTAAAPTTPTAVHLTGAETIAGAKTFGTAPLVPVGVLTPDAAAATASLRTLGTGAVQAAAGNDARLSDSRAPTSHATTHASGGSDPVSIAESQVTNLISDLANKANTFQVLVVVSTSTASAVPAGQYTWATSGVQTLSSGVANTVYKVKNVNASGGANISVAVPAGRSLDGITNGTRTVTPGAAYGFTTDGTNFQTD